MSEDKHTYWRYTVSSFIDKNNILRRNESIKLLKRLSCDGGFINETLKDFIREAEDLPELPNNAKNGDTLILKYNWCFDECDLWFEVKSNE